jgi:hypothetical protein
MKYTTFLSAIISVFLLFSCEKQESNNIDILQVKVYTLDSVDQGGVLNNYLKEAYLPAMHRAGINEIGVFRTIDGRNGDQNLFVVFIPYESVSQFEALPSILEQDESYLEAGKEYFETAYDEAPYLRMESSLMRAFKETPKFHIPELKSKKSDRVYELRSYQSATEKLHKRKVEMFNSGESQLFIDLGFQPMFFGEVISGAVMPNLMYMTCHADEATQAENWKAFGQHPIWNEMKVMEKYQNTVSHIDKWLVYPVEYSDL